MKPTAPYGPVLTQISKCHIFFNFGKSHKIYNFIFPDDSLIYHKVWLRSDENWRRSNV